MKTVLVPHRVGTDSARIWVGVSETDAPPADLSLEVVPAGNPVPLPSSQWRSVSAGGVLKPDESRMYVQVVGLSGLAERTAFSLNCNGAQARFSTLPRVLPRPDEPPFNVLLASCFHRTNEGTQLLRTAVREMVSMGMAPDLKFLCGDQVYLDYPAFILGVPFNEERLAAESLAKYRGTWEDPTGYQDVLGVGGTYFTADDHEFWNNYPNWTTLISNTWRASGREKLRKVAYGLFGDFQSDNEAEIGRPRSFCVGRLSFFVADTRVFRQRGDDQFMKPEDLQALEAWVDGLDGPGVLVVGQPLFVAPSGRFQKRFVDRSLSNYKQYKPLVRALFRTRHSILILTGDVHYARVAEARLWGNGSGPSIFEIISSPCSLVNKAVGGAAKDADPTFPPLAVEGIVQVPVVTHFKSADDHVATLHFSETPGNVHVRIRYWFPRRQTDRRVQLGTSIDLM